jgi:hypothetical protein
MRTMKLSLVVLAMMAAGLVSGCAHTKTEGPLIPAADSPIADVPVPAGFQIILSQSTHEVVPSTGLRFVDHRYHGKDDVLPVVRFYRTQMPEKGWTTVDQKQLHDEITLRYTKNNEDCVVTVMPGTMDTKIRVKIDPAGRNVDK